MPVGFLYVLINPSMPGLAKVGKTTRSPSDRVMELSSATGVPSPFMMAFQQPVADCDVAEQWVHRELERGGYRLVVNREFFNAPLHEIIKIVANAANITLLTNQEYSASDSGHNMENGENLADELYDLACAYQQGTDSLLKSDIKALSNFEQAAALGHAAACSTVAEFYRYGANGIPQDMEKALAFYNKAVQHGRWFEEASIADIFLRSEQEEAAETHWITFFKRACEEFKSIESRATDVGVYGAWYCESVATKEMKHCVPDQTIAIFAEPLLRRIDIRISELAQHPNKELAEFISGRLRNARRFVEGKQVIA